MPQPRLRTTYVAPPPISFADFEDSTTQTATLWHSLGTEAGTDNSIAYWTRFNTGSPSYSAHLVTAPASSRLGGGHSDWWDGTFRVRFRWNTSTAPALWIHTDTVSNDAIYAKADGSNLTLYKYIAGASTQMASATSITLTNNTFYWMDLIAAGTTYSAKVYNDSAGAIGSQIGATVSATIIESTVQAGWVMIGEVNGGGTCAFGGAFANVCTFSGPIPINGYTLGQGTGEAAFCWSKTSPYHGSYSMSVYNATSGGQGFFTKTVVHSASNPSYTISAKCKGTGTPTNFYPLYGANNPANVTADGTWRDASSSATYSGGGWPDAISLVAFGAGTYYFDDVELGLTANARMVAKFGSVDINDTSNWFLQDFGTDDDNHQVGVAQLLYRAKGAYVSDDFGPRTITLPARYFENPGHYVGAALAQLSQAGEQQLTFDNETYINAKYKGLRSRKLVRKFPGYLWEFDLDFIARTPWFTDISSTAISSIAITGNGPTTFNLTYMGSVFCEPTFNLNIPSGNGTAITTATLSNTYSGESLVVNFQSVGNLLASTAYTVVIDCANWSASAGGVPFDISGSFPMLYGPPGQINTWSVAVTTVSGTSSGLTLTGSYSPRWQI